MVLRLSEIEDMDAAANAVEMRLHLGVPLLFAVTEVAGGGDEFFLGRNGHDERVRDRARIFIILA